MARSANYRTGRTKKYVAYLTEKDVEILRQAIVDAGENFTHDKFVYVIWSILSFARSFFKRFLPSEILSVVKLETLRRLPTKMVDKNGKKTEGDLFYLVDTIDGEGMMLVILLEHKSGSARNVAIQTLGYEVDMMKRMTLERDFYQNAEGRYPAPFTVVLAQYDVPQLDDLFYWVNGARQYGPIFKFHLVDLQKENFDDIIDDEPMLYVAMALSRLAYRVKDKKWDDARDEELKDVFSVVLNRDPTLPENFPYFLEVLIRYTSWFTEKCNFNLQKFAEKLMQDIPVKSRKPYKSFLSRLFGDQMPEDYRKLEAKYEDCYVQVEEQKEQIAKQKKQITRKDKQITRKDKQIVKLNLDKEAAALRESILLDACRRFNSSIPSSIMQRLFSITKITVLSNIYEVLQTRSSLEDFERDFDRLAFGN